MKRLSAAAVLGLFFSVFCFAQTQTGNASYNPSKTGVTISHQSLSFNTRVRVTNLGNRRFVEATVNGRIPISPERIADISREAGDALGMNRTGMTLVEIEALHPDLLPADSVPAAPAPAPEQEAPPPPGQQIPAPVVVQESRPAPEAEQPAPVAAIRELQYVPVPAPYPAGEPCCGRFLVPVILLLLLVIIFFLIIILVLLLRRFSFPFWPWRPPLWFKRRLLYFKKRRR